MNDLQRRIMRYRMSSFRQHHSVAIMTAAFAVCLFAAVSIVFGGLFVTLSVVPRLIGF